MANSIKVGDRVRILTVNDEASQRYVGFRGNVTQILKEKKHSLYVVDVYEPEIPHFKRAEIKGTTIARSVELAD